MRPIATPMMSGIATPTVLRSAIHGMTLAFSKRTSVFQKIKGGPPRFALED